MRDRGQEAWGVVGTTESSMPAPHYVCKDNAASIGTPLIECGVNRLWGETITSPLIQFDSLCQQESLTKVVLMNCGGVAETLEVKDWLWV